MKHTPSPVFRSIVRSTLLGLMLLGSSHLGLGYSEVDQGRSVYIYQGCGSCHGVDAEGSKRYQTPTLAGREAWYLGAQLRKFRSGLRGAHDADDTGKIMAPSAKSMDDAMIDQVTTYLQSLETPKPEHLLKSGDVAAGRAQYQTCLACHGRKGEGNSLLKAPALTGLSDWYLTDQLKKFKGGIRGAHPEDIEGAQMRPFAMLLKDKQAIEDVVAYIRTFKAAR